MKKKITIAMSGGVDSAVAAVLLKEKGYQVSAVYLRLTNDSKSLQAARKISAFLKIPFSTTDLRSEFRKKVIDPFIAELKKGNTPNPCVVCNKEIKFGSIKGCLATGHYAAIKHDCRLFQAKDKEKDQSYFLWILKQKQLKRIIFPLQDHTKAEVKELAKKHGLMKFIRSESQEICFIPDSIGDFLKKHLKQRSGDIINNSGKVIGQHQGLASYTIGQRKMIGLSGGPYYVLAKDLNKNQLIITKKGEDLLQKELTIKNVSWISKAPKMPLKCRARIRYRSKLFPCTVSQKKVVFNRAQKAVTKGQSIVFYLKNEVLGGGIIR